MKIEKVLATAGAMAVAAAITMVQPAHAADTEATFTIAAGTLDISVPASTVHLGDVTAGGSLSSFAGDLGTVTVTDNRGALVAAWTATAQSTAFTTGTATTEETVPAASIAYAANAGAGSGGGATASFAFPGAASLATASPVATLVGGTGVNEASWTARLTFTLLDTQVFGTYTGTVTHSVS